MFRKILILEALVVLTMVSVAVYQALPPTSIRLGNEVYELKPETDEARDEGTTESVAPDEPLRPTAPATATEPLPDQALVFPVKDHGRKAVISVFGDKRGKNRRHEGIDIKAPRHTPVVAVINGFIERIREGGNGGKQLYLRAADGRLFYYAHLEDWSVEEYTAVRAGQQLGTVGDSGNARGTTPHLHFEVMYGKQKESRDPLPLFFPSGV